MRRQAGFTLIEIMIAVAIIGILSTIALLAYQDYQGRGEAGAALATLAPLKTAVDTALARSDGADLSDVRGLGIQPDANALGTISSTIDETTGGGELRFSFDNSGRLTRGHTLRFARNPDTGQWTCITDLDEPYRSKACKAD